MKAYTTLLIFLFFSVQSFSQKGFYLKPYAELNAATTYYYGGKPFNSSPYFRYEIQKIIKPTHFSPLYVGVLIGYTFNNKFSIEAGIAQSGNGSGYRLSFNSKYDSTLFYSGQVSSNGGTAGMKIPLLLTLPLFKFDSVRVYNSKPFAWSMRLKLGLNFYRQPKGDVIFAFGMDSIIVAPHTRLDFEEELHIQNNKSILYQLGIETEFNFKRVKGLSLNLYYLYGRRDLSVTTLRVIINQQINYVFNTYGRGSGFSLQLSKKIVVKPKKQRKQKGVDYYK